MSYARQILTSSEPKSPLDSALLGDALDALNDCIQACIADTDADLGEKDLADMVRCIRLCLHCTDVCVAASGVLSRPAEFDTNVVRPLLESCVAICESCGDECGRHADHDEHCRICAEACRRCESACRKLLGSIK
ncbi:MAG TPA: four-helix bundle copper-binding protein [Candidatus Limnocylindrales bacterium]|nr:four-helix bundle copper-binding protein [Candidatus Limnocylindrales bacterium]